MKVPGTNTEKIFSYLDMLKAYNEGGYELRNSTTTVFRRATPTHSEGGQKHYLIETTA